MGSSVSQAIRRHRLDGSRPLAHPHPENERIIVGRSPGRQLHPEHKVNEARETQTVTAALDGKVIAASAR